MRTIIAAFLFCTIAVSAADSKVELEFSELKVLKFSALRVNVDNNGKAGAVEVMKPGENAFVDINFRARGKWTDAVQRVRVGRNDIFVLVGDKKVTALGRIDKRVFKPFASSLSLYRPANWKENPPTGSVYSGLFVLPANLKEFSLNVGGQKLAIKVPENAVPMPDPKDDVAVKVLSAEFVDQVKGKFSRRAFAAETVVTNPDGALLKVVLELTPKQSNVDTPDRFFVFTPWITMAVDGLVVVPVGEEFHNGISRGVSHNMSKRDGEWKPKQMTYFFAVPKSLKAFKIRYQGAVVADGEVQ